MIDLERLSFDMKTKGLKKFTELYNVKFSKLSKILKGKQKMYIADYLKMCDYLDSDLDKYIKK